MMRALLVTIFATAAVDLVLLHAWLYILNS